MAHIVVEVEAVVLEAAAVPHAVAEGLLEEVADTVEGDLQVTVVVEVLQAMVVVEEATKIEVVEAFKIAGAEPFKTEDAEASEVEAEVAVVDSHLEEKPEGSSCPQVSRKTSMPDWPTHLRINLFRL